MIVVIATAIYMLICDLIKGELDKIPPLQKGVRPTAKQIMKITILILNILWSLFVIGFISYWIVTIYLEG